MQETMTTTVIFLLLVFPSESIRNNPPTGRLKSTRSNIQNPEQQNVQNDQGALPEFIVSNGSKNTDNRSDKGLPLHRNDTLVESEHSYTDNQENNDFINSSSGIFHPDNIIVAKSAELDLEDPCFVESTCSFSDTLKHQYCLCDKMCTEFKDCCSDASATTKNMTKYKNHWYCISDSNMEDYIGGMFAVSSCPNDFENYTIAAKCKAKNIDSVEVCVVSTDGVIFKNKFCAICHGVIFANVCGIKLYGVDAYMVLNNVGKMNLTQEEKLKYLLISPFVKYVIVPGGKAVRRPCISKLQTFGNDDMCTNGYINPVIDVHKYTIYKNIFCTNYNASTDSNFLLRGQYRCLGTYYNFLGEIFKFNVWPLAVMFRLVSDEGQTDSNVDNCREWTQKVDDNGLCSHLEVYGPTEQVLPDHLITTDQNTTLEDYHRIFAILSIAMEAVFPVKTYISIIKKENASDLLEHIHVRTTKNMFITEIKSLINHISCSKWEVNIEDESTTAITKLVKTTPSFIVECPHFQQLSDDIYISMDRYDISRFTSEINIDATDAIYYRLCKTISLNIFKNGTTFTRAKLIGGSESLNTSQRFSFEAILTYICFVVSTCALGMLIVLNKKYNITSGVAGNNLDNIAISMAVANIVYIVGVGNDDVFLVCYVAGVILHYVWIAVFTFMSLAVVSIVKNLTKLRRNEVLLSNKMGRLSKKHWFTVLGVTLPAFVVIPAVFIDNVGPHEFSPGYGRPVCFPSKYPGNLIFFTAPVMFGIAVNFFALIRVIVDITRFTASIGHVSKLSLFTNAKVFLRIMVISSLIWVSGVLISFFEQEWLRLVITSVCGLHGLFIVIASLSTVTFRTAMRKSKETVRTNMI